jgi:hypothetical protein
MQELAIQGGRMLDRDSPLNSGDWSVLVSGFAAMKRISSRDKDNKLRNSKGNSFGATLLWSLFDAGNLTSSCSPLSDGIIDLV